MMLRVILFAAVVSTLAMAFQETPAKEMLPNKAHTVSLLYKSGHKASENAVTALSKAAKRLSDSKLSFVKADSNKNGNGEWQEAAGRFPFDSTSLPVLFTNIAGRFEKFTGDLSEDSFFSHVDTKIKSLMGDDDDEEEYGSLLDDEDESESQQEHDNDNDNDNGKEAAPSKAKDGEEEMSEEDKAHKERTDAMWKQYADDQDPDSEDVPNMVVRYTTKEDFLERTAEGSVFMKFYEDWCGWSKRIKKAYMRSAIKHKKVMTFMEVECTATSRTKEFCNEHGVMAFPTFKTFHHGDQVEDYPNGHDEEGIAGYMNYWPFFMQEYDKKQAEGAKTEL